MADLREKSDRVKITRQDVILSHCGFALALFDKLVLAGEGEDNCYACNGLFSIDGEGNVWYSGQCISILPQDV